jgi:hypothetical protein
MQFDQLRRRDFITLLGERGGIVAVRDAGAAGQPNEAHRSADAIC